MAIATTLDWESALPQLLDELASAQDELLALLAAKREFLATGDLEGLSSTQEREELLVQRLRDCQVRRAELLAAARAEGEPGDSLGKLANRAKGEGLGERAKAATAKMRLLRHQSLTNWVLAQRALLHVSQLVEIIATGGRPQPTYGEGESLHHCGSLVNQEA
jgi:flagellar biosynthesis/type III secretory pathway chaperone